ncbi:unnamed protein product [Cylicocyclus nassatus]|uniref:Uncharacterized protein n=1 Tax=Cylicocyclus nassatus TaxID=53992 RepID=A0AA36MH45_CYLNA|nr:unnamed protein product [Cylicocyclus nassatus]
MRIRSAARPCMAVILILLLVLVIVQHRRPSRTRAFSGSNAGLSEEEMDLLDSIKFEDLENILPSSVKHKTAILVVIEVETRPAFYGHALTSVACYARAQNYEFRILFPTNFSKECRHKDVYLRRHCVVAHILPQYHTILYIDADMGVVNPKKRIEEYMDNDAEIIFFDRFYNWEVAAGSYIVRNTQWTQKFLKDLADYERRLPRQYHGTDNGALHALLGEVLFGEDRKSELNFCLRIYYNLLIPEDLFTFEACIRQMLGMNNKWGKIKILKKGTAWVRDNWMTNTKWSPERDFMMHNWKITQLRKYMGSDLPLMLHGPSKGEWFLPFLGMFRLDLCTPGNLTWNYDPNLIETTAKIERKLQYLYDRIERDRIKSLARMIEYL